MGYPLALNETGPEQIYWRYHWKKTDPVLLARKIGAVNWILLRDQLGDLTEFQAKSLDGHSIRAQIMAAQFDQMTRDNKIIDSSGSDSMQYKGGPYTRGMTAEHRKQFLNTKLNQKAREGFRFWVTDPPKPTKFGRYSMGAKHTFLGLCNAPRS